VEEIENRPPPRRDALSTDIASLSPNMPLAARDRRGIARIESKNPPLATIRTVLLRIARAGPDLSCGLPPWMLVGTTAKHAISGSTKENLGLIASAKLLLANVNNLSTDLSPVSGLRLIQIKFVGE
jgi:hypothetical protein